MNQWKPRRWRTRLALALLPIIATGLTAYGRVQSALDPAGPQAGRIIDLWWMMFWVTGAVFLIVMGFLVAALARRRRPYAGEAADLPDVKPEASGERRMSHMVLTGVGITVVILFVFLIKSYVAGRALDALHEQDHLTVTVIGHQWWWEVQYPDYGVITANEIHVPVAGDENTATYLRLQSQDVIHSFWVPQLSGKSDLVPNRTNYMWIDKDNGDLYLGQCAEYCGTQHANMLIRVVVDPPDEFRAWLANQQVDAPEPQTPMQTKGRDVFLSEACSGCHQIRGTAAHARVGPDLTHLATRSTIAAATLPNRKGYLAGWILDPQHQKPGVRMPALELSGPEIQALLAYLESLD